MPAYSTASPSTLTAGVPPYLYGTMKLPTTPAASSVSQAVCMKRNPNLPNCISVEVAFAANPGAFAIDLQVADTNEEKYFVTKTTLNTGLNALFVGRVEVTNIIAKFIRLKMATLTNAVAVTAKIL